MEWDPDRDTVEWGLRTAALTKEKLYDSLIRPSHQCVTTGAETGIWVIQGSSTDLRLLDDMS